MSQLESLKCQWLAAEQAAFDAWKAHKDAADKAAALKEKFRKEYLETNESKNDDDTTR